MSATPRLDALTAWLGSDRTGPIDWVEPEPAWWIDYGNRVDAAARPRKRLVSESLTAPWPPPWPAPTETEKP